MITVLISILFVCNTYVLQQVHNFMYLKTHTFRFSIGVIEYYYALQDSELNNMCIEVPIEIIILYCEFRSHYNHHVCSYTIGMWLTCNH